MAQAKQPSAKAPGAVTPQHKIELFSGTYFGACTLGGIIGTSNLVPLPPPPIAHPKLTYLRSPQLAAQLTPP